MVDIRSAIEDLDGIYRSPSAFTAALTDSLAATYGDRNVTPKHAITPDTRVDIGVSHDGTVVPIECMYETDRATVVDQHTGESFDLPPPTMYDTAHYAVIWTLGQLEALVEDGVGCGYLVFLTNDASFWTTPAGVDDARFAELRIFDGRTIDGEVLGLHDRRGWMDDHGAYVPIELTGRYQIAWEPYTYDDRYAISANDEFRYTVFEVRG